MMWTLFEISINLFQSWLFVYFIKSKIRFSSQRHYPDLLCVISSTTYLSLYSFFSISLPDTIVFLIPFLYAVFFSDSDWLQCAFWSCTLTILFVSTANLLIDICTSIPGISFNDLIAQGGTRFAYLFFSNSILFLMIFSAAKLRLEDQALKGWILIIFFLVLIAIFCVEELVYFLQNSLFNPSDNQTLLFLSIYICLISTTFLIIHLFRFMARSASREIMYKEEISTLAITKQHQEEMTDLYMEVNEKLHDFKHHMQMLENMVQAGENIGAKEYMNLYRNELKDIHSFSTGCATLDALLTAKYLVMKKSNIEFKYTGYPLSELPVQPPDFCAVLGNLLDNAIEAVNRIKPTSKVERQIKLTFSRSWGMFYIFCTNPCDPSTLCCKDGIWISAKQKKDAPCRHALGIRNIEKVISRYEGRCNFENDDSLFKVRIVIPFETKLMENEQ